jgi:hypothetical protein
MRFSNQKKKLWIFGVVATFFVTGIFAYWFLPAQAKNILKSGSAIALQSWKDVFGAPREEYISPGDDILGKDEASSSLMEVQSMSSTEEGLEEAPASPKISADKPKKDIIAEAPQKKTADDNVGDAAVDENKSSVDSGENISEMTACSISTSTVALPSATRKIILSEIAWMGSPPAVGETGAQAGNHEWIELKNISANAIEMFGWRVMNAAGTLKMVLGDDANRTISPGKFYLLGRGDVRVAGKAPDQSYSGALSNSGDTIFLFDDHCVLEDVLNASAGWPGGDNATKVTLERNADGVAWHTSATPGGTPRAENSLTPQAVALPAPTPQPSGNFALTVNFEGDGRGMVTSAPPGISCDATCFWAFSSGTAVILNAAPDTVSSFVGWSGACSGMGQVCELTGGSAASATATFRNTSSAGDPSPPAASSTDPTLPDDPTPTPTSTSTPTSTPAVGVNHLLIAGVQIAGASTTNDFVKLFNPTASSIDVSGWKLRKKSSTGSDQSLRELPTGSAIASGGYFFWVNSAGGFSETIGANVSSTATLAADNSVALLDASGTLIDAVAWGTGTNQYAEGSAYPKSPLVNELLERQSVGDVMIDTDDNASDFVIV